MAFELDITTLRHGSELVKKHPAGQAVEVPAEQLDPLVADAVGPARVGRFGRQVGRDGQAVVYLAEQQGPGVVGDPMTGLTSLDRAVKGRPE